MPSREFPHLPMSEYPPFAARFHLSCLHWQEKQKIVLPSRGYLAEALGMPNQNLFTLVFEGKSVPSPSVILSIARACGESVEELLMVANIDLARRGKKGYDTFAGLIRYVERFVGSDTKLRHFWQVLQLTQSETWVESRSPWRDTAEKILVSNQPPEEKIEFIVRMIEAGVNEAKHSTGMPAPQGKRLVARA